MFPILKFTCVLVFYFYALESFYLFRKQYPNIRIQ